MGGSHKVKGRRRSTKTRRSLRQDTKVPSVSKKEDQENDVCPSEDKDRTQYTVKRLLEQVKECMDTFNYELAQKFLQRALETDSENVHVLECSGNLLIEIGELERAKQCFGRAITLSPDSGHSKYMYMGQLLEGDESVQYFEKGIELMKKAKEKGFISGDKGACELDITGGNSQVTDKDISGAYCSLAEIYLTDSCHVPDADQQCRQCLETALQFDNESGEAYQLLSSYWLSKENKQEAVKSIEKSLSLWLPKMKALEEDELNQDEPSYDPLHPCPMSYQNRIGAAKILMELEMNGLAEEILEGLLLEDDQVVQVWYMLGLLNVEKTGEDSKPPARYFLHMAKKLYSKLNCDDEPVLLHTDELLLELGPGEGLDESWLKNQGQESDTEDDTEEDMLSSDDDEKTDDICHDNLEH